MRDKVVVITGASSGVGRAAARAFAARGTHLGLLARGEAGLTAAAKEADQEGVRALPLVVDVADAEALEEAARTIEDELGPIDVWVNNAMVSVFSPVRELEPEGIRRVTDVTYLGTVYGTLSALRRMLPRDRGTIVQVGSALAHRAIPLQAAYCAAKHAMQGFTESLRTELLHARSRVRVTMVHLPALNTPQFEVVKTRLPGHPQPVPPIYQPEVAADGIVWAAEHPGRRELLVGGTTVATVLAQRVAPGILDRYLARTGFDSQQMDRPVEEDRPHNLWDPLPGDRGAHGIFDDRSSPRSFQLAITKHRRALAVLASIGLGTLAKRLLSRRR